MTDVSNDIPERLVDELIRRFQNIPNTDEQEVGHRLESRRTLLEWWVRDFLDDNDIHVIEAEEGAL